MPSSSLRNKANTQPIDSTLHHGIHDSGKFILILTEKKTSQIMKCNQSMVTGFQLHPSNCVFHGNNLYKYAVGSFGS
jgi:hypothetical protein